ncbi:hypothetical protein GCM10023322_39830 [Rugosimonospora acidiphila]|uniref:SseB protein N-terminal domain-containing protein n=1 Tax=Rugosimonospora acidiphila TaxID=556531 RepID=A0ABP9RX58_9ACTN
MTASAEPTWTPANDTERAMADALRDGDTTAYFRALMGATLYLPGFTGPDEPRVVTTTAGDQTYLLTFTSPESLAATLTGIDGYRTIRYAELAEDWPNPQWQLAVDPGLPIQGYMPFGAPVDGAAGGIEAAPVYAGDLDELVPVNDTERAIVDALDAGDTEGLIGALVTGEVHVPVLPDGQWLRWPAPRATIAVFTAPERVPDGLPTKPIALLDLVLDWPGPSVALMVAPGTSIELDLPGEHVLGFIGWADELVGAASTGVSEPDASPVPAGPVPVRPGERRLMMLQKLVPPDLVDWYLNGHGHLVSGAVCAHDEVSDLETPARLYAAVGLGEPFRPDDREVHAIRWLAPCPDLHPPARRPATVTLLHSHAAVLPHGAQFFRIDAAGRTTPVASYDADTQRWVRTPDAGLLRAALGS